MRGIQGKSWGIGTVSRPVGPESRHCNSQASLCPPAMAALAAQRTSLTEGNARDATAADKRCFCSHSQPGPPRTRRRMAWIRRPKPSLRPQQRAHQKVRGRQPSRFPPAPPLPAPGGRALGCASWPLRASLRPADRGCPAHSRPLASPCQCCSLSDSAAGAPASFRWGRPGRARALLSSCFLARSHPR